MDPITSKQADLNHAERELFQLTSNRRAVLRQPSEYKFNPIVTDAIARASMHGTTATVVTPTVETAERLASKTRPDPFLPGEPREEADPSSHGDGTAKDGGGFLENSYSGAGVVECGDGKVYFEPASRVSGSIAVGEAFYVVHADLIGSYVEDLDETVGDEHPITVSLYNTTPYFEGEWDMIGPYEGTGEPATVAMEASD